MMLHSKVGAIDMYWLNCFDKCVIAVSYYIGVVTVLLHCSFGNRSTVVKLTDLCTLNTCVAKWMGDSTKLN